jgi:hypothetical protein
VSTEIFIKCWLGALRLKRLDFAGLFITVAQNNYADGAFPMLAMQYSIQLPLNFHADDVRKRVDTRSKLFDSHAGLVHKSFLWNEAEHLYAPFYIWKDVTSARQFLLDDLFKGVVETFSRHRVRSWFIATWAHGNKDIKPTYGLREVDTIPAEHPLDHFLANEKSEQEALLKNPGLYLHAVALDADRWEILRFSLWQDKESAPAPHCDSFIDYQVLHVSEP